ncbi:MAG: histone family protein [Archaeoglobaceae archaeon]|nr:histone family protein [Archaeoglobaceae archaeon]MCX8152208.1 histone family protein [Archaeoglobaceae archaeon]MDW8013994.1 histone family protein [Archaeoglobaceae archaeon]
MEGGKEKARELPLAPIERILRKAGAQRISEDAKVELVKVIEGYAVKLGKVASNLAKSAGRKTVKEDDIKEALKHVTK